MNTAKALAMLSEDAKQIIQVRADVTKAFMHVMELPYIDTLSNRDLLRELVRELTELSLSGAINEPPAAPR